MRRTPEQWWLAGLSAFAWLSCAFTAAAASVAVFPALLVPGGTATVSYTPPPEARGDIYVHYGFNGWNMPLTGADAGSEDELGNRNYFIHRRMPAPVVEGSGVASTSLAIKVPVGARALHMAFCWANCKGAAWDNNARRDYAWPIVFPYIGPLLTWNADTQPDSGVVISFEHPSASTSWLKIWREGQPPQTLPGGIGTMHRYQVTGLLPATRYRYQVGVPGGLTSPIYSFKTIAAGTDKVSFVVFGDAQDNGENGRFAAVADTIVREHGDVDMVISTGDMPWNDKPGDWWSFFDKGRTLFAGHVFMPTVGNHDTPLPGSHPDHTSFLRYFALPGTGGDRAFYRFSVGPAAFYGMNSERPIEWKSSGRQFQWLASELRARRAVVSRLASAWTFVFWHKPPFNAGARHWREQGNSRPLTQLFDGVVDWQLSGHEHLGQRFKPLRRGASNPLVMPSYGVASDQGVGYMVVPGGGVTPESRLIPAGAGGDVRSLLAYPTGLSGDLVDPFMGFARVDIDGDKFNMQTIAVTNPVVGRRSLIKDQITYTK